MGDYWVDDLLDVLSTAGVPFGLSSVNAGWERRSRSSGGFDGPPLGCAWHHTASQASVESDLNYMVNGSPDRPVGNVLVDRVGVMWPIAAGAANTQGKGGPAYFSRGTCPLDKGNTTLWAFEIACNGVGEPYSQDTIDATFAASNALNAHWGNIPEDVITHAAYTTRKIDPATATAVQGPWRPGSVNSSGTWNVTDLKNECRHRAGTLPPPKPPQPTEEVDMLALDFGVPGHDSWWTRLTYTGDSLNHVRSPFDQVQTRGGVTVVGISEVELDRMLDTIMTVGDSPFGPGAPAENANLHGKWNTARGRT